MVVREAMEAVEEAWWWPHLDDIVVDGRRLVGELLAHRHEEGVEHLMAAAPGQAWGRQCGAVARRRWGLAVLRRVRVSGGVWIRGLGAAHVDRVLALHFDEPAVEAAAQLDELLGVLRGDPRAVERGHVDAQVLARVHRVEELAALERRCPDDGAAERVSSRPAPTASLGVSIPSHSSSNCALNFSLGTFSSDGLRSVALLAIA